MGLPVLVGEGQLRLIGWGAVMAALAVALLLPNVPETFRYREYRRAPESRGFLIWRPTPGWAMLCAVDADAAAAAESEPAVSPKAINSPNPRRNFIALPSGRTGARRCEPVATALAELKNAPAPHPLSRATFSGFLHPLFRRA